MKLAVGLLVGYVIGSRMLESDYSDVVDALRAVGRSDELRDVLRTVRTHATLTLREVADMLEPPPPDDLVARVTDLQSRRAR